MVLKYRLKSEKLQFPLPIRNVDGTNNCSGLISRSLDLVIRKEKDIKRSTFYITNLGKDRIILGYPWLAQFNPDINWTTAKVMGPKAKVSSLKNQRDYIHHIRAITMQQAMEGETVIMHLGRTEKGIQHLRKTTVVQQMAQATYNKDKVNSEATIPVEYRRHRKVFSEEEAKQFPPKRDFVHRIVLKAN